MVAHIITSDELTEYAKRSIDVAAFSDAQIDDAVSRATDRIRQAALNDYTSDSFEALTSSTAPEELRDIALSLALAILTRGDAGRPQSIDDAGKDASMRVGYLAAGKTHYDESPGAVLVKAADGAGSSVDFNAPDRSRGFDTSSRDTNYRRKNRRI